MIFRYSMLDTYQQCPTKFKRLYLEQAAGEHARPIQEESIQLHFGTAMHKALNELMVSGSSDSAVTAYASHWVTITDSQRLQLDEDEIAELEPLATRFITNFAKLHYRDFTEAKLEETLTMPILDGEHILQGTFDMCAVQNGKLTMVDFKTSAGPYKLSKLYRNPQLYIYSHLYQAKYGILPQSIMYKVFVKSKGTIQTLDLDLTAERVAGMLENVETICKDILAKAQSNNWFCNSNCYCLWPEECFK